MKKKNLLASLGASVAAQTVQARDKFEMADLTMALKRATAPEAPASLAKAIIEVATLLASTRWPPALPETVR